MVPIVVQMGSMIEMIVTQQQASGMFAKIRSLMKRTIKGHLQSASVYWQLLNNIVSCQNSACIL